MSIDLTITRFAGQVVKHPIIAMLLCVLLVIAAASGGRFLVFKTDYRVFFSEDNPQLMAFDALEKMYTENDNVMFIVSAKNGDIFTEENLKAIQQLTREAWQIPYSMRVDSISNFQSTRGEGDDLIVEDLVPESEALSTVQIERIKAVALQEPLLVNRLVSPSGHVSGVNVTVKLPGKTVAEVPEVVSYVRELSRKLEQTYPGIDIRLSGMVLMDNAFSEAAQNDMAGVVLVSFLVMLLALVYLLKSVGATFGILMVIVMSVVSALGLGGYLGFPLTAASTTTPNIVLTVAIANAVHILVSFFQQLRKGETKKQAVIESLRINMQPVFIASATTAIGFLTMNFSDVPPFHHLGTMVAIGVLVSFVMSVVFLPAFLMIIPIRAERRPQGQRSARLMSYLGDFVVTNRRVLLWSIVLLVMSLLAFLPKNELNDVFVHYFDTSIEFRQDADYFTDNLSGLYNIEYSVDSGEPGGISNPQYLAELEKFARWYESQPETIHVSTFSDITKRLNKNLHGDDPLWYRQPQTRELAAQYLLLYEMSLPLGLDLNNQINIDKSATRFTAYLKTMSSNEMIALQERADEWLKNNTTVIDSAVASGSALMFAHIGKRNINSMLSGTVWALLLISFILILALKSLRIGIISLVPNLVPAAMGFGLWALLVGEVGLSLSIVASMTLGIVVDDTVHFLSKYLRARREKGMDSEQAVRYAFATVGTALLVTSVVLIIGFGILATSVFELNSGMGQLAAIIIGLALVTDFFLLPPLLMKLDRKAYEQRKDKDKRLEDKEEQRDITQAPVPDPALVFDSSAN